VRHLVAIATAALVLALTTTAVAEPLVTAPASKKAKKCFKKKHGKKVRVKCKKAKKKPAAQTPTTQTPTSPNPGAPAADLTGQPAIDLMTDDLKGGVWRYFTSGSQTSTKYVLNLCADGTFFRTGESVGVQVYRYGTWKVTDAIVKGDGSGRAAHVVGTTTESDPPPDGTPYEADLGIVGDQWYWGDNPAEYFPGQARCSG
jgi:hypothetical protein